MSRNQPNAVKLCLLVILWYLFSSAANIVSKIVLNDFPYPLTVSLVQLFMLLVYSPLVTRFQAPSASSGPLRTYAKSLTRHQYAKFIIPLSIAKFVATYSSHISLWKIPVSYTHTVKATMPLFTVLLARVMYGERQTSEVYLTLVPIVGGALLATLTELSFDALGFVSAVVSTVGFALLNLYTKKCLQETHIFHLHLLHTLTKLAFVGFLPLWLYRDVPMLLLHPQTHSQQRSLLANLCLLIIDGTCNVAQNVLAFTLIAQVATLSYAVANSLKRVVVISLSIALLHNPVSTVNCLGMVSACVGAFLYSRARHRMKGHESDATQLKVSKTESNLSADYHEANGHLAHVASVNGAAGEEWGGRGASRSEGPWVTLRHFAHLLRPWLPGGARRRLVPPSPSLGNGSPTPGRFHLPAPHHTQPAFHSQPPPSVAFWV